MMYQPAILFCHSVIYRESQWLCCLYITKESESPLYALERLLCAPYFHTIGLRLAYVKPRKPDVSQTSETRGLVIGTQEGWDEMVGYSCPCSSSWFLCFSLYCRGEQLTYCLKYLPKKVWVGKFISRAISLTVRSEYASI